MTHSFPITLAPEALLRPRAVFARIGEGKPSAAAVFFQYALWLGLAPPVCAFFGAQTFGWLVGGEALALPAQVMFWMSAGYYFFLLCGFLFAGFFLRWMLPTYCDADDGDKNTGACFALVAVAGTPLMVGGVAHLYPSLAFNMLMFIPAFLWSVVLFYRGAPAAFGVGAERGMLLTCSMVGALLVMLAGFMGIIVLLWVNGFGPPLGI